MNRFDHLLGITEGYGRRPLKTLGEAGGDVKSTPDTTVDYGDPPREFVHGSPNTAYRPMTKPEIGKGLDFVPTAAALRTKKS